MAKREGINHVVIESTEASVLQVATFLYPETIAAEQTLVSQLTEALQSCADAQLHVRRVTVVCSRVGRVPKYYTFRRRLGFTEDTLLRHAEPASAHLLEIRKLANYDITLHPTDTPDIHLYYAVERNRRVDPHQCFFVRSVVKHRVLEVPPAQQVTIAKGDVLDSRPRSGSVGTPVFEVLVSEVCTF